MKVVSANIIPAVLRTVEANAIIVTCERSESCALLERGQCSWDCPHRKAQKTFGPKGSHKAHGPWVAKQQQAYPGVPATLKPPSRRIARTGDFIFLNYGFMKEVHPQLSKGFLPVEDFTAELIVKLCEAQPRDGMYCVIPQYQEKEVPQFVRHLMTDGFVDLLKEAAKRSPHVARLMSTATQVGRQALLKTVIPNIGTFSIDNKDWVWDGVCLTSVGVVRSSYLPDGQVSIRVSGDFDVYITDDKQVGAWTKFLS